MPVKRRVWKMKNAEITPEAVALFRRGLELQKRGADKYDYETHRTTPEREEYKEIWGRLNWGILKIVGEAGPLDVRPGQKISPFPELYAASVPRALELRAQLMKAMKRWPKTKLN